MFSLTVDTRTRSVAYACSYVYTDVEIQFYYVVLVALVHRGGGSSGVVMFRPPLHASNSV